MPLTEKKQTSLEWASRVILTLHVWFCASGYISYMQAKHQLVSPLIPESTIYEISQPSFEVSAYLCASFIVSLWFYFFRKRIITCIISGASIIFYYVYFYLL